MDMQKQIDQIVIHLKFLNKGKTTILIGVDGGGGSGKTIFAQRLCSLLRNCAVVKIDDFYKLKSERVKITNKIPIHYNFDVSRLKKLLDDITKGESAQYHIYDWQKDQLKPERVNVSQEEFVIVEGLGALGKDLASYFDYKIWLEADRNTRRTRGIKRDGKEWTKVWDEEYLPEDDRYIKEQAPQKAADIIVNT